MANMNGIRINNMVLAKTLPTLILTLLALSGVAAIASADLVTPIRFSGNVSHNSDWALPGTVINAYIDGELSGTYTVTEERSGVYYLDVRGTESDEDELITFEIGGAIADQTDTWHASANAESRPLDIFAEGSATGDPPGYEPPSTGDDALNGGGTSGGYVSHAATPTGTDAQPVSGEIVTSDPSVTSTESTTPAETSTKKLAEKPEAKGSLPGFEAVFAIAGLLAVAYLIRRR